MAKEHHCPNCGPQACNASTSKIHTCGVCAAVWEEVLGETPSAAPATPKPAAPAPSPQAAAPVPPKPPAPSPAKPAAPPPASLASTAKAAPAPATPSPVPAAPAKPPVAAPAAAGVRGEDRPEARTKKLADVVAAARVKRCPVCKSDSLAAPSDYLEQGGRVVLVDFQSYRGHRWYADTGEVVKPPPPPRPTPAPPAAAKTAA